jgi:hypothetical protein
MTTTKTRRHFDIAALRSRAQQCLAQGEIEPTVNLTAVVASLVRQCGCGGCSVQPDSRALGSGTEGKDPCPQ